MSNATWVNHACPAGIRRTSIADTLSLDVQAVSTIAPDVHRVEFQVTGPGNFSQTVTVSSRSLRFPNFSNYNSRIPGSIPGSLCPIYAFGFTLDCGSFPKGTLTIEARVYYSAGSTADILPLVRLINDWGPEDLRHSTRVVHLRGQTGSDVTGDGSPANPVQTLNKAISLARANPAASPLDSAGMNCGGAEIIAGELIQGCGPSGGFNWHTGEQWLTITMLPGGQFIRNSNDTNNVITCSGVSEIGNCSVRLANWTIKGPGPVFFGSGYPTSGIVMSVWHENADHSSSYASPGDGWSVRYLEDNGNPSSFSGISSVLSNAKVFLTGYYRHHCGQALASHTHLYDFKIENYIGIALQPEGPVQRDTALCGIIRNQTRMDYAVEGWVNVQGGNQFVITEPSPGLMRIETVGTVFHLNAFGTPTVPANIATKLAPLVGTTHWQAHFVSAGGNSGIFPIVATGTTGGGNPFVTVDTLGRITVTPGTAPASALLRVGQAALVPNTQTEWGTSTQGDIGTRPYDPHPDIVQWLGTRDRSFIAHVRCERIMESQGFFLSGNVNQLALLDVTDGGHGLRNPFGWQLTDFYLGHCSLTGNWDFNAGITHSGLMTHCVVNQINNLNPAGITFTNNHVISSSGAWYRFPTNSAPYSFEPQVSKQGTGTTSVCPTQWCWPSAGGLVSVGAFASTGSGNWATGGPTSAGASFAGTSSLIVTGSKIASGGFSLSGSSSLSLQGSGIYTDALLLFGTSRLDLFGDRITRKTAELPKLPGGSSFSLAGTVARQGSITFPGSSGLILTAVGPSQIIASVPFSGSSSLTVSGTVLFVVVAVSVTPTAPAAPTIMKQRIHNALTAAVLAGPFYKCSIDPKTGQMTVDTDSPIILKKENLKVTERSRSFRLAEKYRREGNVSELDSWVWMVQVAFPNSEVATEVFENNMDTGIQVPPVLGLSNQRRLLARLVDSDYNHPPSQSPDTGTVARFIFEIATELLRK